MAARAQSETVKKSSKTSSAKTSAKTSDRSKSAAKAANRATPSTAEPGVAEDISAGSSVVGTGSPPPKATEKVKLDITTKKGKSNKKSKPSDTKSQEDKSQAEKASASTKSATEKSATGSADKSSTEKVECAVAKKSKSSGDDHPAGTKKKAEPLKSKPAAKRRKVEDDSPPAAVEVAQEETPDSAVDDDVASSGTATPFNLMDVLIGVHNETGTTQSLSKWMSVWDAKILTFIVYPKANTSGCTKQCVAFSKLTLPSHVKLLGLSLDPETSQVSFDKKYKLNFPLVCSGAKEILSALKCLSADGKIIRSVVAISDDGSVIYEKHKVSPESSCSDFMEFIKKSQSDVTEDEGATALDDGSEASEEKQTDQEKAPVVEKKSRSAKASKSKKDETKSVGATSKAKAKSNKSTSKSTK